MVPALHNAHRLARRFLAEQCGATASEYAVILAILAVVAVSGAAMIGMNFSDATSSISLNLTPGPDSGASFGPGAFRNKTNFVSP